MGLFNFFKPKMPNGVNSNSINESTGMTFYQQSMALLGHCLILIGQIERTLDSTSLYKASEIQLLFSRNIMQMDMNVYEIKDIMNDMKTSLEEMSEDEFMHYTNVGLTEMSNGLPLVVKKEILIYLMMFHLLNDESSDDQMDAIGHIHNMLYTTFGGEDPNEIIRLARININTYDLK